MNIATAEYDRSEPEYSNDSLNCVDVVVEGPGDTTVRPLTGKRREMVMAERERLRPWLESLMRQHEQGKSDFEVEVIEFDLD